MYGMPETEEARHTHLSKFTVGKLQGLLNLMTSSADDLCFYLENWLRIRHPELLIQE